MSGHSAENDAPCTAWVVPLVGVPCAMHTCTGEHDDGSHHCPSCGYWWFDARVIPPDKGTP